MNDGLVWRFDLVVIEWLIVLATLIILSIVGTVVTRRTLNEFRKLNNQSEDSVSTTISWHAENIKTVFDALETR